MRRGIKSQVLTCETESWRKLYNEKTRNSYPSLNNRVINAGRWDTNTKKITAHEGPVEKPESKKDYLPQMGGKY
jgi:hypothetical protein